MGWRKSSFCDTGSCVEWQRSSRCDAGNCVEVHVPVPGNVLVQDSKNPGVILTFTDEEWRDFVAGVKAGEFDV
jgi:hypothetical protein